MLRNTDLEADLEQHQLALEEAAKYICFLQEWKCPMAVNNSPCPEVCGTDTRPWRCWVSYFLQPSRESGNGEGR